MQDRDQDINKLTAAVYGLPAGIPQQGISAGFPAQPRVAPVPQYTTVNIHSEPPRDYIIWSLCCFVYANPFCLGLASLIYSIRSRDRRMLGDLEGARSDASTAHCLNKWATVLVTIMFLVCLITIINIISNPTIHGP